MKKVEVTVKIILVPLIRRLKHPLRVVMRGYPRGPLCVKVVKLSLVFAYGTPIFFSWYLFHDIPHLLASLAGLELLFI